MKSTRKELRKEFCEKVWEEKFDSELLVNRYTLWLEQKIVDLNRESKLHQPTVMGAVCDDGTCVYGTCTEADYMICINGCVNKQTDR